MPEDFVKAVCPKCQAKYRLPAEAQGRVARCKRCGEKFEVPRKLSLEDSVLTWLTGPVEEDEEVEAPVQPKVISMPQQQPDPDGTVAGVPSPRTRRGLIPMRQTPTPQPGPKAGTA